MFLEKIENSRFLIVLKDNLSILFLIPTVFGGLWQLISLISMSPAFVRFFSITQLLADGLFILSLILTMTLLVVIIQFTLKQLNPSKNQSTEDKEKNFSAAISHKDSKYGILALVLIISALFIYLLSGQLQSFFQKEVMSFYDLFSLVLIFFLIFILYFLIITVFIILLKIDVEKVTIKSKSGMVGIALLAIHLAIMVAVVSTFLWRFNRSFILPQNLKNSKDLIEREKLKLNTNNIHIRYFNDQYIFLEIDNTIIKIVKFDDLFESDL